MFIFLHGHMLVSKKYWLMAQHTICLSVCGNLNVHAECEKLQPAQDELGISVCWLV